MEIKLTTGVAIFTSLLMQCISSISPAIAHQQRELNNSPTGFSLQLVTIPEGPDQNAYRHSDGFLHLQRSLTTSSVGVNSGLVHGRGAVVHIGTFRAYQEVILIVSTTSSLTWLQCKPSDPMVPQRHPLFDPNKSPSYHAMKDNSPSCRPPFHPDPSTGHCRFSLAGQEGVWASGYMSIDHFRINYGALEPDYTFGCSHNTRTFNNGGTAAGVLAVGRAPNSLVTRAVGRGLSNFSYCLSAETSHRGFLRFGSDVPRMPHYQTTRILPPQDAHDSAYHVRLIGVSLGDRRLDRVLPEMFARRMDGQGGCIIDLGTPQTTMIQEAYRIVEEAMWSDHIEPQGAERVEQAGYGLCVPATEAIKGHLPSLSFHFAEEDSTLVVSPEQLFVVIDDKKAGQVACLAMKPGRQTIIGALQQVDKRFVFDLKESKLSFSLESCDRESV